MPKRNVAGALLSVVAVGVVTPLAGWTVYSIAPSWGMRYAMAAAAERIEPQISNIDAKGDRLIVAEVAPPASKPVNTFRVASIEPGGTPVALPPRAMALAAAPPPATAGAPLAIEQAAAPLPHNKPKRAPEPSNMLDDSQIASIKSRLRLTPEQVDYWPAVEIALRDLGRHQTREARKRPDGKSPIDVNSPPVQKLVWAAMPLLGMLREDQKREVRSLVRIIGLDKVASMI